MTTRNEMGAGSGPCWIAQLNGPITVPLSLEQQQG